MNYMVTREGPARVQNADSFLSECDDHVVIHPSNCDTQLNDLQDLLHACDVSEMRSINVIFVSAEMLFIPTQEAI